jgi:pimeloyl-ACP methyl ester carboxylesterase
MEILLCYCTVGRNHDTNASNYACFGQELHRNYTVIAPDLRGFGDSSKPVTGYDGNTTAEDIYQLLSQLGFSNILLVAHDVGSQTTYSYAADHPENVSKLVLMDFPFPGFSPPEFGENGPW